MASENATILKFGYPGTLIAEYPAWFVLLRPQQVTAGALVLAHRGDATAFSDLCPRRPMPGWQQVIGDIERNLKSLVRYERINYLMLMMVDPHVHFHVLPALFREPHIGWPRRRRSWLAARARPDPSSRSRNLPILARYRPDRTRLLDARMKTLDRYILAKTMWPLIGCIAVALIALLLERMVRLLDLVVNKGGPFFLILKMLANLIPHYLGIAIPAAFLVGVLVAVMRMSGDSELDAIHAMGVGLRRMVRPLMALAILLTIFSACIIGYLQPYTRYAYQALVFTVTHTAWNTALERGTFFTGLGDMTIMVEGLSDNGRQLNGIFLYNRKPDGSATTTTAENGRCSASAPAWT